MVASDDTIWSTWRQVAQRLGGRFVQSPPPGQPSIIVTIDDVRVVVLADEYNWGTGSYHRTCLTASAEGAVDLSLLLVQGADHDAGAERGLETLELPHQELNERFIVKANDDGLARLWLSPEIQQMILGAHDETTELGYRFEVNWENVSARRLGLERDGHRLEQAIRAVAGFGRQGIEIMCRCRDIAELLEGEIISRSTAWRPDGSTVIRVGTYEPEVTIDHLWHAVSSAKQTLFTRISEARASHVRDRYLISRPHLAESLVEQLRVGLEERRVPAGGLSDHYWIGGEELAPLSRRLDRARQRDLLRLAPAAILGDEDRISVWLEGFVDDIERMRDAIEVVEALSVELSARRPLGPYR